MYEKAGNIYKISNKKLVMEYFNKVNNYTVKLSSDDSKLKILLTELSELYLKIDYVKSIKCLDKILNLYMLYVVIYLMLIKQKNLYQIFIWIMIIYKKHIQFMLILLK